jgi:hypothetical protein
MSQTPGEWPPDQGGYSQGGYPPQSQPPGYPSQAQPGGYGTESQPGGYPPQSPGGYPPQGQPGIYSGQPGAYPPSGAYPPPGGFPPGGAYPGSAAGYPPPGAGPVGSAGGPPARNSRGMIIGIVVAAVVLLAAVGGIILVLNRSDDTQPSATITPGPPAAEPTPEEPSAEPRTPIPSGKQSAPQPTQPTEAPTQAPNGEEISLGRGISLTPADGYEIEKSGTGYARVSNGDQLFLGQAIAVEPGTNPGQLCDAWHRKIAEGQANGKFADPKTADLNTKTLEGATCVGTFTASNGSGSQDVVVYSLASVRTDGVTALGTMYFLKDANGDQLNKDFNAMMNSMLEGQASGG